MIIFSFFVISSALESWGRDGPTLRILTEAEGIEAALPTPFNGRLNISYGYGI